MATKLAATTTVQQTTEVQLTPKLKRQLLQKLQEYQAKLQQLNELKAWTDAQKAAIEQLFVDAKESGALISGTDIEGYRVKMVFPTSSKLDKKRLMEIADVTPAQLEEATVTKPGRPYVRLSMPSEGGEE